jgi:hypothetical protein
MEPRPHPKYVCKYTKIRKKILHNTPNFLGEASVQKLLGPLFTNFYSKIVSLQSSLLFLGKVGAYPRVESLPVAMLPSKIGSYLISTNIRLGRRGLLGTNTLAYK